MELTPKQQASEAIRQAETILLITGSHPSVDQAAAVVGLAAILRKFGKRVSAVISDGLPASVAGLEGAAVERQLGGLRDFILKLDVTKAEVDKLRTELGDGKLNILISPAKGSFAPSDVTFDYGAPSFEYDLAIVLGVPTRARIDRIYEQNTDLFDRIPLVNLDFHRSNEGYGAINLIDGNASSLCEMLVATSESLQSGLIDAEIGTILLMGIMAATDRFTAAHTTSKSLTVAAQMMAAGGRQPAVVKALYRERDNRGERGDRSNERPGGDRNRGGQRPEQQRQEPRAEARPGIATAPAAQPQQPKPHPQPNVQPEAQALRELPIIDPGHIEISESVDEAQPANQPQSELETPRPAMADFAAAAELLAQQPSVEPDQSSSA